MKPNEGCRATRPARSRSVSLHTSWRSMARMASMGSVLVQVSCVSLPLPNRLSGGPDQAVGWKLVVDKREPNFLLASDRTECEVTRERFDGVKEGESVFCQWR
jgi:hypothetical protein